MMQQLHKLPHLSLLFKRGMLVSALLLLNMLSVHTALADYVGEAQTTKFLDQATQDKIAASFQAGGPGLVVGDEISYIIQFTPVPAGTTEKVGGGAYVTDYIPAGTQVVGAQFVQDNGGGNYTPIAPPPPAPVADVFVPQYSETGIFYSSDPRTAMYTTPLSPTISGANGYLVIGAPAAVSLPTSLHNAWDQQVATFVGIANPAAGVTCAAPAVPLTVPSPVAGPQSFIKNDNLGLGPWQRISYPGSMFGTAIGVSAGLVGGAFGPGCIGGTPTSLGWNLSSANPLPANVNAVRFAGGQTTVGQLFSVRITLKITAPIPVTGIVNNSEVYGGDVSVLNSGALGSRSNIWKYVFPSVANANTTLIVVKTIVGMCAPVAPATTCTIQPYTGSTVPSAANLNLRYRVSYLNGSGGAQSNVVLTDTLPLGAALVANTATVLTNQQVISGPPILPTTVVTAPAAAVQGVFKFTPIATLGSGAGGVVEYNVLFATAPPTTVPLPNTVTMTSATLPLGVTSTATTTPTALASLTISKSTSTPSVIPGGTASYSISIPNGGGAIAGSATTSITVKDTLPSNGLSIAAADRFAYLAGATTTATITSPPIAPATVATVATVIVSAAVTAPTVAPFRESVLFTLPLGTTIPAGGVLNINFSATVGTNMPATATPYLNDASTTYVGGSSTVGGLSTIATTGVAPVTVNVPLTLVKSIDCVYVGVVCTAGSYVTGASIPTASKVKYKLTYSNTGAAAIAGVVLQDTLPANTSFVAASSAEVVGAGLTTFGLGAATAALQVVTFPAISSLPAGASGAVTFDAQLGTALVLPSGSNILNNAKVTSTLYTGGTAATLNTSVTDQANLTVTKTTSTPVIAVGGVATYSITVKNTGNVAATAIVVKDALPFTGTVANALTRFSYTAMGTVALPLAPSTLTAPPAPVVTTGATNSIPYNVNLNQQQVTWTFTAAQALAPGASVTITFTATAGASIAASTTAYLNSAQVNYASGLTTGLTASANNVAAVTIPSNLTVTKSIDCVYNAAATACNAYNGTGIIPLAAKIRYKIAYQNTAVTAQTNVTICDRITSTVAGLTATIASPTLAPTPTGPFANAPALPAPNTPAAITAAASLLAPCSFPAMVAPVNGVAFSFPTILSLAGGASGVVYYDITTNAATGATIANTGKVVSTQAPGGESSTVTSLALAAPSLTITKSTSTPTLAANGVATYIISVTNTGSAATTGLKIYDFLPFNGTLADPTKRFAYTTTTGYTKAGVAFTPTTPVITPVVAPTIAPYSSNLNQQQVGWDFGTAAANQLAAGETLTITFTATAGSALPVGNYSNSVGYEFTSTAGPGSGNVNGQAVVTLVSPPVINLSKVVAAYKDPVNLLTNPKFLPGGIAQYGVTATNTGGVAGLDSIFITDSIPSNTSFYVGDIAAVGMGPALFVDGTPTSGLTYSFPADFAYSTDGGTTWTSGVPAAGANGCNVAVNRIRFNPKGVFIGAPIAPSPSFTFNFRVCLN